ncbi:MATE family efflux transporter [Propionispora sp. 2/2-37]|uniref:MATE family efflux transporter n=1 Tax=Propionispora sp. 2/2-37 TaxID=1677858 RepID=UPI00092F05B8
MPQLSEPKQEHLLRPTINRIAKMSLGTVLLASSLIFFFASTISSFFSPSDKLVAEQASHTLKLVCLGQLFSSVYMVMRGALTGCRDTRFIVYEGLFSSYIVFLPLAYILALKLNYGIYGGYMAFVLWCITDCAALTFRFCQKSRRKVLPAA